MENEAKQTGFAILDKNLLTIWPLLTDGQRLILPILLSYMPNIFPKHETVAARAGVHRNSVVNNLRQLEEVGLLVSDGQRGRGKNGTLLSKRYSPANLSDSAILEGIKDKLTKHNMSCARSTAITMHNLDCARPPATMHNMDCARSMHNSDSSPCTSMRCAVREQGEENKEDKKTNQPAEGGLAASPPAAADASGSPAACHLSCGQDKGAKPATTFNGQKNEVEQIQVSSGQTGEEAEPCGAEQEPVGTGEVNPSPEPLISHNPYPAWADIDYDPDAPEPVEFGGMDDDPNYPPPSFFTNPFPEPEPDVLAVLVETAPAVLSASEDQNVSKAGPSSTNAPAVNSGDSAPASAPASTSTPAAPTPSPTTQRKSVKRAGRQKEPHTDEDKALICASANNMQVWLCYGMAGFKVKEGESWPPHESTSWRVHLSADGNLDFQNWTAPQVAAYFWAHVSDYRQNHGIPITIPMMGKLIGHIKTLDRTMTRKALFKYIDDMYENFDLVKADSGNFGSKLMFDEDTLLNKCVRGSIEKFNNSADSDLYDLRRKYHLN